MKKAIVLAVLTVFSSSLLAVSMNFTGNTRTEATGYYNLGLLPNTNPTKSFLSGRLLLDPDLIIDDHFSIKSQWNLLNSPGFTPPATAIALGNGFNAPTEGLSVGQGGYVFGDPSPAYLILSRAWLEWTSDFGVLRLGRQPFSWGYGLIWDAGNNVWDDFQTTLDRLEYRLHLGHVIGALAYTKPLKRSVLGNTNDQDFYSAYLQYDNPELDVEGGILYEMQVRSSDQGSEQYVGDNPYAIPQADPDPGVTRQLPPLATAAPAPLSNSVVDVYLRKTFGYFTAGGEIAWLSGSAVNSQGSGSGVNMNAFGVALNGAYEFHKLKAFLEFLYASGDSNVTSNHVNGFVVLHRNRRPGLILGRELLGPYYGNQVGLGSPVYYGASGSFSGVFYFRPGVRIDWAPSWTSGAELIVAQKAAVQPGESPNLGIEVDLGTDYIVYKNFELGLNVGYLFAGLGLVPAGAPGISGAGAVRTTASVKF